MNPLPFDITNITLLVSSFRANPNIKVVKKELEDNDDPNQISLLEQKGFKKCFIEGIMKVNNCMFEWHDVNDNKSIGTANIFSIDSIIESTADYAHLVDEEAAFEHFHIVDLVRPEIVIGIFSGPYATNSLYLEESNGIAQYLGLDMEGYIKMIIATKGFYCWQFALLEYKSGKEGHSLKQMKEHLPRLFPEVKIEEVFALYDSLYISELMPPGAE